MHFLVRSRDHLRRADRDPRAQVQAVHAPGLVLAESPQLLQEAGHADPPQQRPLEFRAVLKTGKLRKDVSGVTHFFRETLKH